MTTYRFSGDAMINGSTCHMALAKVATPPLSDFRFNQRAGSLGAKEKSLLDLVRHSAKDYFFLAGRIPQPNARVVETSGFLSARRAETAFST